MTSVYNNIVHNEISRLRWREDAEQDPLRMRGWHEVIFGVYSGGLTTDQYNSLLYVNDLQVSLSPKFTTTPEDNSWAHKINHDLEEKAASIIEKYEARVTFDTGVMYHGFEYGTYSKNFRLLKGMDSLTRVQYLALLIYSWSRGVYTSGVREEQSRSLYDASKRSSISLPTTIEAIDTLVDLAAFLPYFPDANLQPRGVKATVTNADNTDYELGEVGYAIKSIDGAIQTEYSATAAEAANKFNVAGSKFWNVSHDVLSVVSYLYAVSRSPGESEIGPHKVPTSSTPVQSNIGPPPKHSNTVPPQSLRFYDIAGNHPNAMSGNKAQAHTQGIDASVGVNALMYETSSSSVVNAGPVQTFSAILAGSQMVKKGLYLAHVESTGGNVTYTYRVGYLRERLPGATLPDPTPAFCVKEQGKSDEYLLLTDLDQIEYELDDVRVLNVYAFQKTIPHASTSPVRFTVTEVVSADYGGGGSPSYLPDITKTIGGHVAHIEGGSGYYADGRLRDAHSLEMKVPLVERDVNDTSQLTWTLELSRVYPQFTESMQDGIYRCHYVRIYDGDEYDRLSLNASIVSPTQIYSVSLGRLLCAPIVEAKNPFSAAQEPGRTRLQVGARATVVSSAPKSGIVRYYLEISDDGGNFTLYMVKVQHYKIREVGVKASTTYISNDFDIANVPTMSDNIIPNVYTRITTTPAS